MIFIAIILLAALPHTDKPWAHSAFIALAGLCAAMWIRNLFQSSLNHIAANQKKIYEKLPKRG